MMAVETAPLRRVSSPSCARIEVDGRSLLNFGGSAYLGLGGHAALLDAGAAALRRFGVHSRRPAIRRHTMIPSHELQGFS